MKNKFIRFMSLFLLAVLLFSVGIPSASASSTPFTDVPRGAWFHDAVAWAYSHGIAQGTSSTTFSPNRNITRGQFVTFMYRIDGSPDTDDFIRFIDVADPEQYFFNSVTWAFENGLVTGIGGGLFAPHRNITREEIAVILFRFAGYYNEDTSAPSNALNHFPDRNNVSGFAIEAMRWATHNGIIRGDNSRRLNPRANATRAEAITMIQRFIFQDELDSPGGSNSGGSNSGGNRPNTNPPPFPIGTHAVHPVNNFPAPNRWRGRWCIYEHRDWMPDMIVMHTAAVNAQGAIQGAFSGVTNRTSYHFVIDRHGTITQLVPITDTAWANGTTVDSSNSSHIWSAHPTIRSRNTNANYYTVSIGFGDAGPQASASSPFIGTNGRITEAQINAGAWLIEHIRYEIWQEYGINIPINRSTVIGHNEVTPRTTGQPPGGCPGIQFPFNDILNRVRQS